MNRIVNSRRFNWSSEELDKAFGDKWLYIGRGKGDLEPSLLGNPFKAWEGNAVKKFRIYLWNLMKSGRRDILDLLTSIDNDTVLVCHCDVAEKCHGYVIAQAATWIRDGGFDD